MSETIVHNKIIPVPSAGSEAWMTILLAELIDTTAVLPKGLAVDAGLVQVRSTLPTARLGGSSTSHPRSTSSTQVVSVEATKLMLDIPGNIDLLAETEAHLSQYNLIVASLDLVNRPNTP